VRCASKQSRSIDKRRTGTMAIYYSVDVNSEKLERKISTSWKVWITVTVIVAWRLRLCLREQKRGKNSYGPFDFYLLSRVARRYVHISFRINIQIRAEYWNNVTSRDIDALSSFTISNRNRMDGRFSRFDRRVIDRICALFLVPRSVVYRYRVKIETK